MQTTTRTTTQTTNRRPRRPWPARPGAAALAFAAALLLAAPAFASLERARAAQQRGDLRTAQIELRNAVRNAPGDGALRAALAQASLDLGDADTAEKEARAALERGFDRVAGTALLVRSMLGLNRARELLRELPPPPAGTPPAVAAQILTGRGLALMATDQAEEGQRAIAEALRIAPADSAEPHLAAAVLALRANDRAAAEAAVDRALAADPRSPEARMRKAALEFARGEPRAAVATYGRLVADQPQLVQARVGRAEALLRLGEDAAARADVDAALRSMPGHVPATYLRALLQVRAQDWRGADETLVRLGPALPNIPEGLLLLATTKRALNQREQAEDAARRFAARFPDDPRGAKLIASLEMEGGRAAAAAATLQALVGRGRADAEALDMLGRAQTAAGRPREAADAFARAAELAPDNAGVQARLAAARLAIGDTAGMVRAGQEALRLAPEDPAGRQLLAVGALARGDLETAEAELGRLPAEARNTEIGRVVDGTVRHIRLDLPGARAAFEAALRDNAQSVPARLGLARVATSEGRAEEAERLLGEVLRRDPQNAEAMGRLAATTAVPGPRGAAARAVLEEALRAAPGAQALALVTAGAAARAGDLARAAAILEAPPLAQSQRGPAVPLALAEIRAAQQQWDASERAARQALAEDPNSALARRQLATLLLRRGEAAPAEGVIQEGLRAQPNNQLLLETGVAIARQTGGVDRALEVADRLAGQEATRPASLTLRGDVLLTERRFEEAARAFAASYQRAPSSVLALRQAAAWGAANRPNEARAALTDWLGREPRDAAAQAAAGLLDLQAGREREAEARFAAAVELAPGDAVSLNNLAWLLQARGGAAELARARPLAERAFNLAPTAEIADTLGWILVRGGEAPRGLPLLRQAAAAAQAVNSPQAPGITVRFATALAETGARDEALRVLEPLLAQGAPAFPERAEAERLLARLRGGGR